MKIATILLIILTIVILSAAAVLALLINTVLPDLYYTGAEMYRPMEDYQPEEKTNTTTTDATTTKQTGEARRLIYPFRKTQEYPFLVSVSVPLYIDDLDEYIFSCTGVIIDSFHFLSSTVCLYHYDVNEIMDTAIVRSDSDYVSTGGTVHKIVDVMQMNRLVSFKVRPEFKYAGIEVYVGDELETEFLSVGWEKEWPAKEVTSISTITWYSISHEKCNSPDVIMGSWGAKRPDVELTGRPLITTKTKQLVGIEYEHTEGSDVPRLFKRYNLEMATLTGQKDERDFKIGHTSELLCSPITT